MSIDQCSAIPEETTHARFPDGHPHPPWCNTHHDLGPRGYFHLYTPPPSAYPLPHGVTVQVASYIGTNQHFDEPPAVELYDHDNGAASIDVLEYRDPDQVTAIAAALLDAANKLREIQAT